MSNIFLKCGKFRPNSELQKIQNRPELLKSGKLRPDPLLILFFLGLFFNSLHATPYGAQYYDTNEYLIGKIYVKVFFVESSTNVAGTTENWTSAEISSMTYRMYSIWNDNIIPQFPYVAPGVSLSVIISTETVTVSTEPIQGSGGPYGYPTGGGQEQLWVGEIVNQKGYNIYTSTYYNVAKYLDDLRTANNCDWAVAIFCVDNSSRTETNNATTYKGNNLSPMFASGTGGPYCTVGFRYANPEVSSASIVNIYAHEVLHTFYAMDEYSQPMYNAAARQGYLNENNSNFLRGDNVSCLMFEADFSTAPVCTATKEVIGWRDTDIDGIPDILDVESESTLVTYSQDPTTNTILNYTGSAVATATINQSQYNPDYTPLHDTNSPLQPWTTNSISINEINLVQYSIISSTGGLIVDWSSATAIDGNFDETTDSFTFTTPALSTGTYTVRTRARNSVNIWETTYSSDTITINASTSVISISISTNTYGFGLLSISSSVISISSITVTNDGNVAERFRIRCGSSVPSNWSPVSVSPNESQFRLLCVFNSTQPVITDFDISNDYLAPANTDRTSSTTVFSGASQTGDNVGVSANRSLWFRLDTPSANTVSNQQSVSVTITAEQQ